MNLYKIVFNFFFSVGIFFEGFLFRDFFRDSPLRTTHYLFVRVVHRLHIITRASHPFFFFFSAHPSRYVILSQSRYVPLYIPYRKSTVSRAAPSTAFSPKIVGGRCSRRAHPVCANTRTELHTKGTTARRSMNIDYTGYRLPRQPVVTRRAPAAAVRPPTSAGDDHAVSNAQPFEEHEDNIRRAHEGLKYVRFLVARLNISDSFVGRGAGQIHSEWSIDFE